MTSEGRRESGRLGRLEEALSLEAAGNLRAAHDRFRALLKSAPTEGERARLHYLVARSCVASGTAALRAGRRHLEESSALLKKGAGATFPLGARWLPLTAHLVSVLDGFLLLLLRREREASRALRRVLAGIPGGAVQDEYARAQAHHNLALCAVKLQQPDEAHEHFRRAMEAYAGLGQEHAVSRLADGLGQFLSGLGKFREARTFLMVSLEIKKRHGDLRGQAISSGAMSRAAARAGDLESAAALAQRVLDLSEETGDRRGLVAGLIYRADAERLKAQRQLEIASVIGRGAAQRSKRAIRALLAARADYLAAAARSPDVVFRLNASVGLAFVHHYLGAIREAQREWGLARRLYASQQGKYPEIEEALKEMGALLRTGPSEKPPLLRLGDHVRDAVEGQRMAMELQSAKAFQGRLLPQGGKDVASVRVDVHFEPCSETSGDLYDFFDTADGGFAALGDVTGHGAAAAMLMTPVIVALREAPPGDAPARLGYANDVVARHAPQGQFVTLVAVAWRHGESGVSVLSAGHDWPLIVRAGGKVERLSAAQDPALGISESQGFTARPVSMGPGDRLLLYSDGLTECRSERGELYEPHLEEQIRALARKKRDPAAFLAALAAAADRFRDKRPAEDDRTLVLLTWPR